jgi:hypothetical protein
MPNNLHTPTILPSGKEPPVSIKYSVVWDWSCSGRFTEEKKSGVPANNRTTISVSSGP